MTTLYSKGTVVGVRESALMGFPTRVTMNTPATSLCYCVSRQKRDARCVLLHWGEGQAGSGHRGPRPGAEPESHSSHSLELSGVWSLRCAGGGAGSDYPWAASPRTGRHTVTCLGAFHRQEEVLGRVIGKLTAPQLALHSQLSSQMGPRRGYPRRHSRCTKLQGDQIIKNVSIHF